MIARTLAAQLLKAAKQYPVLSLTGPRQSGKTTLARSVFPDYAYCSLEDPAHRSFALEDPRGFLGQFQGQHVILDEVQRTPEIFSAIQTLVDLEDVTGRFILTGSQNFLLLKSIGQTLAGRCAVFHLLPFSLDELTNRTPLPVDRLGQLPAGARRPPETALLPLLFNGFYPRIHDKKLNAQDWLRNYYQTYLERDVRDILNVGDLESFRRFVGLCAGRTSQLLNLSSLASDCGITHTTARRWLSVLEASFLVALLRPHHRNYSKRLIKAPKLYFLDTGLLCYLLRIRDPEDLLIHSSRGAIFESFVVAELLKRALHNGKDPDIFFWRDAAGHEVDVIIDSGRKTIPLEIKSGETISSDYFAGLNYWRKLAGQEAGTGAIIYAGADSYMRNDTAVHSWWNW